MKVTLKERVTITVEAGSEVEITSDQYEAIADMCDVIEPKKAPARRKK